MLGVHRHERAVFAPLALLPSVSARSIAKVEVFDDERTVTTRHGRTAGAACYLAIDGAEESAERAKRAPNPDIRLDFLEMEGRWLKLARSYQFLERLGSFTTYNNERD